MKKAILPALALVLGLGFSDIARANLLTCGLTYDIQGGGLQIGLGYFKLSGPGKIECIDVHGEKSEQDVLVTLGGHPLELNFAAGWMHVYGASGGINVDNSIEDFYGHYWVANGHATVGVGAGASFSVQNTRNKLVTFNLGVSGSYGLGVEAGMSYLTIEPVTLPAQAFTPAQGQTFTQPTSQQSFQQTIAKK